MLPARRTEKLFSPRTENHSLCATHAKFRQAVLLKTGVSGQALTRTLGVKTVRRTLSTHSSYPDAGQLPTGIDRALRLLIAFACTDSQRPGGVGWTGVTRYLHCLRSGRRRSPPRP